MKKFLISPSILSANFAILGKEIKSVIKAGADTIHLDVMDNHFVPNLTFGPILCKSLINYGITVPINIHLMADPIEKLIIDFAKLKVHNITFHVEASNNINKMIQLIKNQNCKVGIALNPSTPLCCLNYIIDELDSILIMSVNPGKSGQKFIPKIFEKIYKTKKIIKKSKKNIRLEVDGGININNIKNIAISGADTFIIGSEIFNKKNYKKIISLIRQKIEK